MLEGYCFSFDIFLLLFLSFFFSRAPAVESGGAKMDVLSQTLNGGGKMDVLAGALKETFSDLDFEAFEPEPTLLQNNQTQVTTLLSFK